MNWMLYFIYSVVICIILIIYYLYRDKNDLMNAMDLMLLIIECIIGSLIWVIYIPVLIFYGIWDSLIDILSGGNEND